MSELVCEVDAEGVALVTLNRPERRNSLTLALWRELAALYRELARDERVRSVILTGAGGHFCAGADISEFPEVRATAEQARIYSAAVDETNDAILELPKPTIAVIEGFCMGGGLGLAVANDFRVADADASFSIPAARLGIVYGAKETRNLYNIVGLSHAKRLLFGAERISAQRAAAINLVDCIAEGKAHKAGRELAARLAENAPLSIAGSKLILRQLSTEGVLDMAAIAAAEARAAGSEDYAEAVRAFAEKRKPTFRGK